MIEERTDKENYVQIMFDSITDQVESVLEISKRIPKASHHARWNPGGHRFDRRDKWVGRFFHSWNHAKECTNSEWAEGIRMYDNAIAQLRDEKVPEPKSLKRKGYWSEDDGDEVCLDRLQKGQPYMRHTKRHHRPGPISTTIITDVTTHCGHKPTDIVWRGVAAICLTEILERAGYRVELWAANHCAAGYQNHKTHLSTVRLKHGHDPLDPSTLVIATSGWYFRTFFFGGYWLYTKSEPENTLGMPVPIYPIKHMITPDTQCIICSDIWSHSQAITWVRNELEKIK